MNRILTVDLAYGQGVLQIPGLPADRTTVVEPGHLDAAEDPYATIVDALRWPVAGRAARNRSAWEHRCYQYLRRNTSPATPAGRSRLAELDGLVDLDEVVVLVATGTHRGNTPDELRAMLGDDVVRQVEVVNHDARDESSLTWIGRLGDDVPVWLNSRWVDADVRITTGFVEPHFFAGFSGGPKMVAPSLAGLETTMTLHDAKRIGHPNARWG